LLVNLNKISQSYQQSGASDCTWCPVLRVQSQGLWFYDSTTISSF